MNQNKLYLKKHGLLPPNHISYSQSLNAKILLHYFTIIFDFGKFFGDISLDGLQIMKGNFL